MLTQSVLAFSVLKICGAAYLMYLAWGQWQQSAGSLPLSATVVTGRGWFRRGVGVALTNPKAWLFISALFPQFISLQQPTAPQFAGLTLIFVCCSVLAHTFWLSLARFGIGANPKPAMRRVLGRIQALLLALIAVSLWWTPLPT